MSDNLYGPESSLYVSFKKMKGHVHWAVVTEHSKEAKEARQAHRWPVNAIRKDSANGKSKDEKSLLQLLKNSIVKVCYETQ